MTRRDGSLNGSRWSSTALATLKIAALAPIPSASVAITAAVKPGRRLNVRSANRTSCVMLRMSGVLGVGGNGERARLASRPALSVTSVVSTVTLPRAAARSITASNVDAICDPYPARDAG
jgi:hypothetical protein